MSYKLIVSYLCVLALVPVMTQAQSYKKNPVLGEVIAYRTVDLISHAKENKYIRQSKIANNIWSTKLPGSSQTLYKGDRGERAGQFCGIWMFESIEKRDYYFPLVNEGDEHGTGIEEFMAVADLVNKRIGNINYTYVPDEFKETGVYTDYFVLGYDQLENPTQGGLIAIREVDVKSGMEADYEEFCQNTIVPTWQKQLPGMEIYILKGARGLRKAKYAQLMSFESTAKRDYYFPLPDSVNAEIVDEYMEVFEKTNANTYLNETPSYTDYFRVN